MGDPNNQIRLVGQPSLGTRLRDPSLAQLYQRIAVSYHIASLGFDETEVSPVP
jgi:type II secretory pathway predicted ATPase ExeA